MPIAKTLSVCLFFTGGAVGVTGCFSSELDPTIEGAFVCSVDTDCPAGQACDGSRCVLAENVPKMEVLNPEPFQSMPIEGFPDDGALSIRIRGNLQLVPPGGDDEPGTGFVELTIDGETMTITEGALSGGVDVVVNIDPTPGVHRISAAAIQASGVPYGGAESVANTVFWLNDGQPHVALTSPWPRSEFGLGTPEIDIEVATINFMLRNAQDELVEGIGHVHVHYDDDFPACAGDTMPGGCDGGYITIVAPPPGQTSDRAGAMTLLPASGATEATMTAILRNDTHTGYRFPFGSDDGEFIFDTIRVLRVEGLDD